MKHFTLTATICILSFMIFDKAFAQDPVTHNIAVGSYFFNPNHLVVNIGDTILWTFESGDAPEHTTSSTSIPTGADNWHGVINNQNPTYFYVPVVAGEYNYQCNHHPAQHSGSFIVEEATSVQANLENVDLKISFYPNPASEYFVIEWNSLNTATVSIEILNLNGQAVLKEDIVNQEDAKFEISHLLPGVYILKAEQDQNITYQRIVVQ